MNIEMEILIDEVKADLLESYTKDELKSAFDNSDHHEMTESFIPVYYAQLIEKCNDLDGSLWRRVWLEVDEFAQGSGELSPHDLLQANLFGLYSDAVYSALEKINSSSKSEEE
jgi:hypothetical protein